MPRLVPHSLALAAVMGVVAIGSVALKAGVSPANREQLIVRDLDRATVAAAALLEKDGFAISRRSTRDSPIMHASNGACSLTIVFGDPRGFHRGTVNRLMSAGDRQRTFYAGDAYAELPVDRTWLSYYQWVMLAEMGHVGSYPLVEHVIFGPGCDDGSQLVAGLRRITARPA